MGGMIFGILHKEILDLTTKAWSINEKSYNLDFITIRTFAVQIYIYTYKTHMTLTGQARD